MKKSFTRAVCFLFSIVLGTQLFAQKNADLLEEAALKANRRTALRSLALAKEYASKGDWSTASSQAQFGLAYDSSISDLWYLNAIALDKLGEKKADVIPVVEKALFSGEWVDYNKDGARILYADLLSDTSRSAEAIAVLDIDPVLFSADAEYIRAKAYYRIHDDDSLVKARVKIETARKMYPEDIRFPLLFYKYEDPSDETPSVRKIADSFIAKKALYDESTKQDIVELEIKTALFARGEQKNRLLKSFAARNLEHPLYAAAAVEAGLMSETDAFDYFTSFSDGSINFKVLAQFLGVIKDESVKSLLKIYLNSFGGVIFYDTDSDGIDNMYVKYYRGRPETISYDKNQDGVIDWRIVCDFGVPVNVLLTENNLSVNWSSYPYLGSAVYRNSSGESTLSFQLVQETLFWSPIAIVADKTVEELLAFNFYTPHLLEESPVPDVETFAQAAFRYEIPSREREGASITFTILDGEVQLAKYMQNEKLYAQAQFENGVPTVRTVDVDGDGIFETTEIYGFDKDNSMQVHTREEERAVMTNLFGLDPESAGFYLHLIQIDSNTDTIPDFTEEYLPFNGKITSWDLDADALWDIRYVRYPRAASADGTLEPLIEDALFYLTTQRDLITVTTIDGIPSKVISKEEELNVIKDESVEDFYWIGKSGRSDFAQKAKDTLAAEVAAGSLTTVDSGIDYMLCVRVGENYYGIPFEN